ncbi:D-aminoacyl-tRNA deacylase [Halarchaeum sp. P4]|uniref:D-aminoacyl-tRNA deacylase n=1 Tax=Halarchaeum sp. P4 TaxID=3421639 RepID=UPI003EBAF088
MTVGIVVSRADSASRAIGERLLALRNWERADDDASAARHRCEGFELREFEDWHLELDDIAEVFDDPELVVFASRHSGETGPFLTAHFTGNFGAAEHGGADRSLAEACPNAHREVVSAFADHAPGGYEVGMECTHHGPTSVGVPSMFVELGSGEDQWADEDAAEAVARAILDLQGVAPHTERTVVAFGGGHYVPRPTRVVETTDWAVGHIAADWCLDDLGDPREHADVVDQVFVESDATRAVVDGEKPRLRSVIDDLGYDVVSETWLRETTGVDLDLVDDLETHLCSVDDGLRFGDAARREPPAEYVVADHPDGLWADAHSVDPDAALAAASEHALAYTTEESGNRVAGEVAFADAEAYDDYVDALVGLLDEKYDDVTRDDAAVHVVDESFDPEKAMTLGVPEGPKFGRLAAGQPVEVNGEEISPETVSSEREETYPLAERETVVRHEGER